MYSDASRSIPDALLAFFFFSSKKFPIRGHRDRSSMSYEDNYWRFEVTHGVENSLSLPMDASEEGLKG